jgi:hypothetical protein
MDDKQVTEKATLLVSASLMVSVGVSVIQNNLIAGSVLVALGSLLFLVRELIKK